MLSETTQKKTAIVLGVNGQDGSYLAECLVKNGWRVIGLSRQKHCVNELTDLDFTYEQLDITDTTALDGLFEENKPDAVFHTAAIHGPNGFNYEAVWKQAHLVNTVSLHGLLQSVLHSGRSPIVFYFGSAKVFGKLDGRVIREDSTLSNQCIYSITKNASSSLIKYYRDTYGIKASTIWFFNHESARRHSREFFVTRIVDALRQALIDKHKKTTLQTLDFWCDIGHAREYMQILADNVNTLAGRDVVMATGKTVLARDMVKAVFAKYDLDALDYINVMDTHVMNSGSKWRADISLLCSLTGNRPQLSAEDVIDDIYQTLAIHPGALRE